MARTKFSFASCYLSVDFCQILQHTTHKKHLGRMLYKQTTETFHSHQTIFNRECNGKRVYSNRFEHKKAQSKFNHRKYELDTWNRKRFPNHYPIQYCIQSDFWIPLQRNFRDASDVDKFEFLEVEFDSAILY